jgi:hypothetical protein
MGVDKGSQPPQILPPNRGWNLPRTVPPRGRPPLEPSGAGRCVSPEVGDGRTADAQAPCDRSYRGPLRMERVQGLIDPNPADEPGRPLDRLRRGLVAPAPHRSMGVTRTGPVGGISANAVPTAAAWSICWWSSRNASKLFKPNSHPGVPRCSATSRCEKMAVYITIPRRHI